MIMIIMIMITTGLIESKMKLEIRKCQKLIETEM